MKKLKFGILSIILVLIISISGISFATNDTSSDLQVNANNNTNQTSLASDLYLTDDTIELTQNVEGNAFLFPDVLGLGDSRSKHKISVKSE